MFDLEKFKTGEYFVHLPTEDIYRDAMEFLEKEGFHWISGYKMSYKDYWIEEKENTIIVFDNIYDGGVYFGNLEKLTHIKYRYKRYLNKPPKELPINFKKNYSIHIGGDDYTDKLSYGDTVSTNKQIDLEGKPNDLVKSPNHYIGELGLEVEEVLRNFIPRYEDGYVAHRMASAIEYLLRAPLKNGEQDLEKAGYNIQQALEHIKKKEGK